MVGSRSASQTRNFTHFSTDCSRMASHTLTCLPRSRRTAGTSRHCSHAFIRPSTSDTRRAVQVHRNMEALRNARSRQDNNAQRDENSSSEPTLEEIRGEHRPTPVRSHEEVTELVGLCLWDVFSDNHDVIAADGRAVDIGSFRGAGAFLDEHLTRGQDRWCEGDYLRFYLGTIWISRRADLAPVYAMIFRRLRAVGADWMYHFPHLYLSEFARDNLSDEQPPPYSVSEAAAADRTR